MRVLCCYWVLRCDKTQKVIGKCRDAALSNNFLYYSKPQQAVQPIEELRGTIAALGKPVLEEGFI